jgi:hypothetical protein
MLIISVGAKKLFKKRIWLRKKRKEVKIGSFGSWKIFKKGGKINEAKMY